MRESEWVFSLYPTLWEIREQYGKLEPLPRELSEIMEQRWSVLEKDLLNSLTEQEGGLKDKLREYKREIEKQRGETLSRPALCAWILKESLFVNALDVACECLQNKNIPMFILFYDASLGINKIVACILEAEEEIAGDSDLLQKTVEDIAETAGRPSIPMPLTDQIGVYLTIMGQRQNDGLLLRKDPSGFLLVDHTLRQLKEKFEKPSDSPSAILIPEFVIAGAKLATITYKTTYPLTEQL